MTVERESNMNRHWQSTRFAWCFLVVWAVSLRIADSAENNPQPATDRPKPMPTEAEVREFLETKSKAEAGNVDAQYKLGGMFAKGAGTAKDDASAVLWYRKVAEQNDPRGQSMLGVMYTNARGVPRDYAIALKWFHKAAEQNSAHAQYNLGHMYGAGKGVPQDDTKSAEWYRKAAEQNDVNSQRILGALYAAGRGVPQDLVQAHAWTKVSGAIENDATKQQLMKLEAQMTAEQKAAAVEAAKEIETRVARRQPERAK